MNRRNLLVNNARAVHKPRCHTAFGRPHRAYLPPSLDEARLAMDRHGTELFSVTNH
jgi:hypothetical protein